MLRELLLGDKAYEALPAHPGPENIGSPNMRPLARSGVANKRGTKIKVVFIVIFLFS
jgi:hypothetical protein